MPVITISREFGSGGDEIAEQVCKVLHYRRFGKNLMAQVAREEGIPGAGMVDYSEEHYQKQSFLGALLGWSAPTVENRVMDEGMAVAGMAATIRALRKRGDVVVVGRGSQVILRDLPDVLHVRVVARLRDRVQELVRTTGLAEGEALRLIEERDQAAAEYARRFHGVDWTDPTLSHLTINTSLVRSSDAVELIVAAARRMDERAAQARAPEAAASGSRSAPPAGRIA